MENLAGERESEGSGLAFEGHPRPGFRWAKVAADAGLPTSRELEGAPGPTGMAGAMIEEGSIGKNLRHGLTGPLHQLFYARLAG